MRVCFLDIEASGIGPSSYPVEIAWAFEDGEEVSMLISPPDEWGEAAWEAEAAVMHGLTRPQLKTEGFPVKEVAARVRRELSGCLVLSDAPKVDLSWLEELFAFAPPSSPDFELHDFQAELFRRMSRTAGITPESPKQEALAVRKRSLSIYSAATPLVCRSFPRLHRALFDARHLRALWSYCLLRVKRVNKSLP